jgi:hypothetical protein
MTWTQDSGELCYADMPKQLFNLPPHVLEQQHRAMRQHAARMWLKAAAAHNSDMAEHARVWREKAQDAERTALAIRKAMRAQRWGR